MVEFKREFFKKDPVFHKLYLLLKENHKVAKHTENILIENRHKKDFCEEARHFMIMPGQNPIYLHYDVSSWFKAPLSVVVKIESIGVYDSFMEYETARTRSLHSGKNSDIPNIN